MKLIFRERYESGTCLPHELHERLDAETSLSFAVTKLEENYNNTMTLYENDYDTYLFTTTEISGSIIAELVCFTSSSDQIIDYIRTNFPNRAEEPLEYKF